MVNRDFVSAVSADYKLTPLKGEQLQANKRKKNMFRNKVA